MAKFTPPFKVGTIVTNDEITKVFKVGNMGGMRRSKRTGTLVIISDHTKGLYDDKWYGDELHYTGISGSINFGQPKHDLFA
jgi:5-methylcytosine-specific restriction protein A